MKPFRISIEARIALLYLLFSSLWIFLSDHLLETIIQDPGELTHFQSYKGWGFVAASATLIFFLLRYYLESQRQAELKLLENEERYRLLFETSLDAILLTAPDGRVFAANPAACQIFDHSEADICELGRTGMIDMADPGFALALDEREKTGHFTGELTFVRRDGTKFPGEISTAQFRDRMGRSRTSMIIRDVTERKLIQKSLMESEEQLRRLNSELEQRVAERTVELNAALLKAQESDRLKSAFLATMSHELRTPLNSIIGFSGVLSQGLAGPLNDEQAKQIGMIRQSSQHLLSLINDVLDLSKIEAGQLEIKKSYFDLRLVVEGVLKLAIPMAQKKELSLHCIFDPNIELVWSDRRRVEQVLFNLVSNAIKFTEKGEVRLECHTDECRLSISVHDTGIGIKQEGFSQLFKPFRQIETGLNRRHEGTGLGLSICANLAHLLGGEISVQSEWGKGSVFMFTLPIQTG